MRLFDRAPAGSGFPVHTINLEYHPQSFRQWFPVQDDESFLTVCRYLERKRIMGRSTLPKLV